MLFPGDWVEVLSAAQILSTLDADSTLEALPFMPEMLAYCGLVFQVQVRADRTCVRALPPGEPEPIRALQDCVVLAGLRCNGAAHGGCQLGCMLFWKERWLRKVDGPRPAGTPLLASSPVALPSSRGADPSVFFCQGTDLGRATRRNRSKWSPIEYLHLVRSRTFTIPGVIRMLHYAGVRKVELTLLTRLPFLRPLRDLTLEPLGLKPGEWVEVKSMKEVLRTLDARGTLKGLAFSNDMYGFCGQRLMVQSRVQTILDEETGRTRTVQDTVILAGTTCRKYMGCARQMPLLWREAWLKRVDSPFP
jgi:hypothetical protein